MNKSEPNKPIPAKANEPGSSKMILNDASLMPSYQCDCGNPAKFFKLETGSHQCEQCTLNQIYAEEQQEDIYAKVLMKMKNIMAIRQKAMKKKLAAGSDKQRTEKPTSVKTEDADAPKADDMASKD